MKKSPINNEEIYSNLEPQKPGKDWTAVFCIAAITLFIAYFLFNVVMSFNG